MPDLKISQLTSATTPLAGTEVLPVVQSGSTVKVPVSDLTAGRAVSASALTASSGNLAFSGTAQRITGDFSNATVADRLAFQTSTVNGNTTVNILPNGTGNNAIVEAYNSSDPANAGILQFRITNTVAQINASLRGTGAYVPLTFVTGGSERVRVDTSGNVGIGDTSPATRGRLSVLATTGAGRQFVVTGSGLTQARYDDNNLLNVLSLQNYGITAASQGVGILWSLGDSSANANDAGSIQVGSEGTWGATAASRDSFMRFSTTLDGNINERMRIDSSGNVGIGTTSPSKKLDVFNSGTTTTDLIVRNGTVSLLSFVDAGAGYTGTSTNHPLLITTNNAERMRISPAGFVAIGRATTDTVRLFVQGSTTGSSDFALSLYNSAEAQLMYVRNDGLITTGATTNSPYNYTTGSSANVYVDSSGILYRSTSSLRYKSDVADATHGLAEVLKLRSVTYKGKNDGEKTFGGLIAEEVHDAGLTEFVAYDKEGRPDALHYGNMVALLVKAIQELEAKVAALEAK